MLNKNEQKVILDAIEGIYDEKIAKITAEKDAAIAAKNELKEKLSLSTCEIKELRARIKELEKELANANKTVAKYNKLVDSVKK